MFGLLLGTTIYGHCNGYFGRDFYPFSGARIEGYGKDWIVVREIDSDSYEEETSGQPMFASFDDSEQLIKMVNKWSKEDDE